MVFTVVICTIVLIVSSTAVLSWWAQAHLKTAMSNLLYTVQKAQETVMGCNCKGKINVISDFEHECADPTGEQYRQAYLGLNKRVTVLTAQLAEVEIQSKQRENSAHEKTKYIEASLRALEDYTTEMFKVMPTDIRETFSKVHGSPPIRMRLRA